MVLFHLSTLFLAPTTMVEKALKLMHTANKLYVTFSNYSPLRALSW